MQIKIRKTTMMDGDKVTDVDIMTNTRVSPHVIPRCITTFNDQEQALDFANRLVNLCAEFDIFATTEVIDV